jgi:hypothetical protein
MPMRTWFFSSEYWRVAIRIAMTIRLRCFISSPGRDHTPPNAKSSASAEVPERKPPASAWLASRCAISSPIIAVKVASPLAR